MERKTITDIPVNRNASPEAAELLRYLADTAGKKIIAGQHTQTNPMEEIDYIRNVTGGPEPRLRGFELLSYSPNINEADASPGCLLEIRDNRGTVDTALKWAEENPGGIVTLSFHWFSPVGGRDKSFYSANTDFDPERVLVPGTDERRAFFRDMDVIAGELDRFRQRHIPVLWRPFHESDGTWFWWGRKGPGIARELYKLMFYYYTEERCLDNLLWVWNCRTADGYPGDSYADIISVDIYLDHYIPTDYADDYFKLISETTERKVAALAEVGYLPDVRLLRKSHVPWAYVMLWSKEFCMGEKYNTRERMRDFYLDPYTDTMQ